MKTVALVQWKFLQGYPPDTLAQVQNMLDGQRTGTWLLQ